MWDEHYSQPGYVYGTEPSGFLIAQKDWLVKGQKALAVADGEGRNSVFMAEQGLDVTAMDSSSVGLAKAEQLAVDKGVQVAYHLTGVNEWDWSVNTYDLVVAVFIQFAGPELRDEIFANMIKTLKPGGILLLHGYTPRQLAYGTGGPSALENLYTKDILLQGFAGMEILRLEEYDKQLQEGSGHSGMSALIDLVTRKPE